MITLCFLFGFRPVWVMTLRLSNIIMFLLDLEIVVIILWVFVFRFVLFCLWGHIC